MHSNLAAEVFLVSNILFSNSTLPSGALIVKQQEQMLWPVPWPSFEYNSYGVYPLEPCSELEVLLQWEHMQQWRPPDGAYSWVCMIGLRAQILFSGILVEVAGRKYIGVCSFLETCDQEKHATIFAIGCQARRLCYVDLRPWTYSVTHFIELYSSWLYMLKVGAIGRLSFEKKFSTTNVLFLPMDISKFQPWPPPPSMHGSVPASDKNPWLHSWLELLLFGMYIH
jgi:hypothetical protein